LGDITVSKKQFGLNEIDYFDSLNNFMRKSPLGLIACICCNKNRMKILNRWLFLSVILLPSCSSSIKSIVDSNAIKVPYQRALIVIPYEQGQVQNFCEDLQEALQFDFETDAKKADILLVESKSKELSLNDPSYGDIEINGSIQHNKNDLVIIFKPTEYGYSGSLQSVEYRVVAIDVATKKEVWKAILSSTYGLSVSGLAKRCASQAYSKLISDKVL
jgi:hypothetical protein